jgi:hypothetical protein
MRIPPSCQPGRRGPDPAFFGRLQSAKPIPGEGKETLSSIGAISTADTDPENFLKMVWKFRVRINAVASDNQQWRSAPAAIGHHAVVQFCDPAAGGAFAKPRNQGMDQAGAARQKQASGKGKSHPLMLEIVLADGLGMAEKQARKHDRIPLDICGNLLRFSWI